MELTKEEAIELLSERYMTMSMCADKEYCAKQNAALDMAISALRVDSADIINRQKAEIEQLKVKNEILIKNAYTAFQDGLNEAQDLYASQIRNEVKQEAIKEFVERLKKYHRYTFMFRNVVPVSAIDSPVEKIVEVEK